MKTITHLLMAFFSILAFGQSEVREEILFDTPQQDDTYSAGETIRVNAPVHGDLVLAGGKLFVYDSIVGDLTAAGGDLLINGTITDDVRIAVGKVTIDAEIGDDLLVFGGEVILSKNAKIHGNLKCFAGNVQINGTVDGNLELKGADIQIDGSVKGISKIVAEDITIGPNAKFYNRVEYWSRNTDLDFKNSLINTNAQFNENLGDERSDLSLRTLGTTSLFLWIFYVLSAFLVILVLHALFRNTFSSAVEGIENNWGKSFGLGLVYLIGIPILILFTMLMIVGIPLGIFATVIFIFSILFGHLIASLLIVYYIRYKKEKNWGFWNVTFLALLCAIVLRLLTIIPLAGLILSVILLAITYGALTLKVIHSKKQIVTTA